MLMAGGFILFISSFLDWKGVGSFGVAGTEVDAFGLLGLLALLLGIGIAVLVALQNFANIALPQRIVGYSINQLIMIVSFAIFFATFCLIFAGDNKIGLFLAVLASGVMTAGAFMETLMEGSGSPSGPPTTF